MTYEPNSTDRVYLAALAGLLHDIGKFAQRTGAAPDTASQAFTSDDYGDHGAHAKWSISFIQQHVPKSWRAGLSPVLYHHRPQDQVSKVVALADRLSAAERESAGEASARQLLSVFCRIGKQSERPPDKFWPLAEQRLTEETVFPHNPLSRTGENEAYPSLWERFVRYVQTLPGDDLETYIEGLLYAFQRYTWCVPGAFYRSVPDVSLYDHSRTTAALAASLAHLEEPLLDELLAGQRTDEPLVLMIGGDISGVQDFIYTITARGAAKGLRGRSFYLQMLTEAVVRFILRELHLPITNLIYAGGGHLYLLAPVDSAARLEELRTLVSRKLLACHGGDLYLALGWASLCAADFKGQNFKNAWRRVNEAMNTAKRRRFSELEDPAVLAQEVFGPLGQGGDEEGECQVCHYDGPVHKETDSSGEERRICSLCQSLEELGADLRDASFLLLGEVPPKDTRRASYRHALGSFGIAVGLAARDGTPVRPLPKDVRRVTLLAMDDSGDSTRLAPTLSERLGCPVAPGTRYTVNVTPRTREGDVATFDWLQKQSNGVKRLGVLRMDVDDLGELFQSGMGNEATLSRVAALSSALALFFEGWVGELCRRANCEHVQRVYAIYSGGDDLFIVGSWDALPALANQIRQDFARFAAGNKRVHISGGLTLHAGKYPLYQAAQDAEHALDNAKDLVRPDNRTKDAFNFLDLTIPWEQFTEIAKEQKELSQLVETAGANRAVLRTLMQLYAQATRSSSERGKPYWGPWMWHAAYRLKRMEDRNRSFQDIAAQIRRIRNSLSKDGFRHIETLGPAARWAELLTRKEQDDHGTE